MQSHASMTYTNYSMFVLEKYIQVNTNHVLTIVQQ